MNTPTISQKLWNYCNVFRGDPMPIQYAKYCEK
jgi:ABC-type arginine/histidine transport system permease subunit